MFSLCADECKPACKVDFQALLQHYSHLQARHTAEIELHRHAASPSSDGDTLHSRGSSLEEVWAAIPKDPVPSNKRQVS